MPAPPLDLAGVNDAIRNTSFHDHLHFFEVVPSTQTLALQAARTGQRHGVWIADEQTAGRGRGNHAWHSPARAGLLLSALVTPSISTVAANHLSLTVALACQAAIAEVTSFIPREQLDIRWPNDLLLRGAHSARHRKVGGILIETAASSPPTSTSSHAPLRYAVVGIGLNVNHLTFPPGLDPLATSLRRESLDPAWLLSREQLLSTLLRHLDGALDRMAFHKRDPGGLASRDLARHSSWISGKPVSIPADPLLPPSATNQPCSGVTDGLTPEGFLRVLTSTGDLRIVRSGGVRESAAAQNASDPAPNLPPPGVS